MRNEPNLTKNKKKKKLQFSIPNRAYSRKEESECENKHKLDQKKEVKLFCVIFFFVLLKFQNLTDEYY